MIARSLGIAFLVFAVAAQAGVPEPSTYRMDDYNAPVPDTLAGGKVLHTAELKPYIDQAKPVLIDVLPAPKRPEGVPSGAPWMPQKHRDITGSVWLPDVGRGAISAQLTLGFTHQLDALSHGNKAQAIVFYCRAQCWMSWNAAKRAISLGYTDVVWYPDGVEGWQAAGLPMAVATPHAVE